MWRNTASTCRFQFTTCIRYGGKSVAKVKTLRGRLCFALVFFFSPLCRKSHLRGRGCTRLYPTSIAAQEVGHGVSKLADGTASIPDNEGGKCGKQRTCTVVPTFACCSASTQYRHAVAGRHGTPCCRTATEPERERGREKARGTWTWGKGRKSSSLGRGKGKKETPIGNQEEGHLQVYRRHQAREGDRKSVV